MSLPFEGAKLHLSLIEACQVALQLLQALLQGSLTGPSHGDFVANRIHDLPHLPLDFGAKVANLCPHIDHLGVAIAVDCRKLGFAAFDVGLLLAKALYQGRLENFAHRVNAIHG